MSTVRLLPTFPDVRETYRRRFRPVLVDEYQGDDDQSIYVWRGARVANLHQFSEDFQDAETIRLEQNYRSTACILKAANALIANNQGRLGKELWTEGCEGEPISLYAAFNEHDEARYVVESIEKAIREGMSRSEIAILYRSNAQSRVLEEALLRERIPVPDLRWPALLRTCRDQERHGLPAPDPGAGQRRGTGTGNQRAGTRNRREDR